MGEKSIVQKCLKMIDEQAELILNSNDFLHLPKSVLEMIVKRETLDIAEIGVFNACMKWASNVCNYNNNILEVCTIVIFREQFFQCKFISKQKYFKTILTIFM